MINITISLHPSPLSKHQIAHISEIMQDFSVLGLFCSAYCHKLQNFFFSKAEYCYSVYAQQSMCTCPVLFIHSSVSGHLGCFEISAVFISNATTKMETQVSLQPAVSDELGPSVLQANESCQPPAWTWNVSTAARPLISSTFKRYLGYLSLNAGSPSKTYCNLFSLKSELDSIRSLLINLTCEPIFYNEY